jgi:hypothetical protein
MTKGYEFQVPISITFPVSTVTLPMRNWCCLLVGTSFFVLPELIARV